MYKQAKKKFAYLKKAISTDPFRSSLQNIYTGGKGERFAFSTNGFLAHVINMNATDEKGILREAEYHGIPIFDADSDDSKLDVYRLIERMTTDKPVIEALTVDARLLRDALTGLQGKITIGISTDLAHKSSKVVTITTEQSLAILMPTNTPPAKINPPRRNAQDGEDEQESAL